MPEDFGEVWALLTLLYEQKTGTHTRAKEKAEEAEAARQSAAYRKSVALLKQRQEE